MTVLHFPKPKPSFVEQFRQQWRDGDFVGCVVGASFECREVQNECVVAAIEAKRESVETGAPAEVIREMDVAIRMLGGNAAGAPTRAKRDQMARVFRTI